MSWNTFSAHAGPAITRLILSAFFTETGTWITESTITDQSGGAYLKYGSLTAGLPLSRSGSAYAIDIARVDVRFGTEQAAHTLIG